MMENLIFIYIFTQIVHNNLDPTKNTTGHLGKPSLHPQSGLESSEQLLARILPIPKFWDDLYSAFHFVEQVGERWRLRTLDFMAFDMLA